MKRKALLVSIFVTAGVIAFLSGYLLMSGKSLNYRDQTGSFMERFKNDTDIKSSESNVPGTLPISNKKFISFINPYSNSGKIIAVDKSGSIVEIDIKNYRETVIANLKHANVSEALLSPRGDSAVYSFYDAKNNKKYSYFHFKKDGLAEIAGDLKSVTFSADGNQTAYIINSGDGGELLIAKGANITKRALKTRLDAAVINWPSDFISIVSRDKSSYGSLFILKGDNTLNKIISDQQDLDIKWSPSGEKLVFSSKGEDNSNRLFYKEPKTGKFIDLNIDAVASKCAWFADEIHIVCGLTNQSAFKDEFYRINLADGSKTLVATPSINLLTKELVISRSRDIIFVLNEIDGKLYILQLK